MDRGMTSEAAYYAARRKFGNVAMAKEDARAVWIPVWIDQLQQDARYGVRMLRRSAGVSAVVIATLAIGIGANTAIFSVIRAVLLKPAPYAGAHRLVQLSERQPVTRVWGAISGPNYLDWAYENTVFERMAGVTRAAPRSAAGGPSLCTWRGAGSRRRTLRWSGCAPRSAGRLPPTRVNQARHLSSCSVTGCGLRSLARIRP
jgi:hypothetical protein